jgi:hypothetical protein
VHWRRLLVGDPERSGREKEVFELCGTWAGSMEDASRIEGTINGTFAYYSGVGPTWLTDLFCHAADHHFTLIKR